jgi:hypothetical protein
MESVKQKPFKRCPGRFRCRNHAPYRLKRRDRFYFTKGTWAISAEAMEAMLQSLMAED